MEREELFKVYGFGDSSERICLDSVSQSRTEKNIKALAEHMAERLNGKQLYLFTSFDMNTADELQIPFADFIEQKYSIRCTALAEPVLGTKHYMNRRGAVTVEIGELEQVIENVYEYPYHMFAVIYPAGATPDWAAEALELWNGRALQAHVLKYCCPFVLEHGGEFFHLLKNSEEISLNCFYKAD